MTNRMTSLDLFEKLDGLSDMYIAEAEILDAPLSATVLPTPRRKGRFSQFMNSGWGVAIICALVAVSVMGGIIWAGFHAGDVPSIAAQPTEDLTFEQETMEDIDPPAAEIAAKAPKFGWEKSVKSVQTTAFYSPLTYNLLEAGDYQVTEITLATHADDTRTLMFRLINRETYEVMARYTWDATEGKWGVMDMGGAFAVYCATRTGTQTLMKVDAFWWKPELEPDTYNFMGRHIPTVEESTMYIWKSPNASDTAEWSAFIREWYPTTYLCMDEALGDLTFYTEDNRYTDGWERMRLFWQDLYILDGEETTGGLEIVTEAVGPEDVVTEWSETLPSRPEVTSNNLEFPIELEPPTEPEDTTKMPMPPTEPASEDLEFYITQDVGDVDFSSHAEIYGWFGAREFLGRGYETVPDEDGNPSYPEHYVSYVIGAYPDESDGGEFVTSIVITDPQVKYYDLTVNASAEAFRETFEGLGYAVEISVNANGEVFSAKKGNLSVYLRRGEDVQATLSVRAEVTNREGIVY